MRYWDSSALVSLHVKQASTADVRRLYEIDDAIVTWVLSDVEVRSALWRLRREGAMSVQDLGRVATSMDALWEGIHVVSVIEGTKMRAKRLLGVHPLRSADALQLGAAILTAGDDPSGWEFVCLDRKLAEAAQREGFAVVP